MAFTAHRESLAGMSVPTLLLFVKYPDAGRVKTRLAATMGFEEAARIHRVLVTEVLRRIPAGISLQVWFDPPGREGASREWLGELVPRGTRFLPQRAGDLGERLIAAFAFAFESGHGPVAAIGGDCPDVAAATFAEAWAGLAEGADVVLGPSADGGYYLVALARPLPALFEGIPWGESSVLATTLERVREQGLAARLLDRLEDVDTEEDWVRVRDRFEPGH